MDFNKNGNGDGKEVVVAGGNGEVTPKPKKKLPPVVYEARCHVCTNEYRNFIEAMVVKGFSYSKIAEKVPGKDGQKLDRRSISNHAKNHMALQDEALRQILEEEADFMAQNYEEGIKGAITHRGVLEVAIRKGYDDILEGNTVVEPRDLIQIVRLKAEMDKAAQDVAVDEIRAQFAVFMQAIRSTCDLETQGRIAAEVKKIRLRDGYVVQMEESLTNIEKTRQELVEGSAKEI